MKPGDRVRIITSLRVGLPSQHEQRWLNLEGREATIIAYEPYSAYKTPYVLEFEELLIDGEADPPPPFHYTCRCEGFYLAPVEDGFSDLFPRNAVGDYKDWE